MNPSPGTRRARFAGRLYPEDAATLAAQVADWTRSARGPADCRVLLLPHGGLAAAGPVAAAGWARLDPGVRELALVGPLHAGDGAPSPLVADTGRSWQTPCGEVAARVASPEGELLASAPDLHDREHSLEPLVAWLAARGDPPRILPLLAGPRLDPEDMGRRLAWALGWLAAPGRGLVCTTDLDHYLPPAAARRAHDALCAALEAGSPEGFLAGMAPGEGRMRPCGPVPTWLFLAVAAALELHVEVVGRAGGGPGVGDLVGFVAAAAAPAPNR